MTTNLRASWLAAEPLVVASVNARVSQVIAEPLVQGTPHARASQLLAEPLAQGTPHARASQLITEPLARGTPRLRASQLILEVLCYRLGPPMLPVYPDLPGLAYSTFWTPQFLNMPTSTAASGADIDLSLAATPLHDFELSYEFLRGVAFAAGSTEWKTFAGFWLQMGGTPGRCLFKWVHDYQVKSQAQGTTDGTSSQFGPLVRTLGANGYSSTEPVGWVNGTEPFNVYLDGLLQDPSSYQLIQAPVANYIKFNNTPASGLAITCDMNYYYYCKLAENSQRFEEFMNTLWSVGKVKLHSCRAGA